MVDLLVFSLLQTLLMVAASLTVGVVGGFALGTLLYRIGAQGLRPKPLLYRVLSFGVNSARSIPYIILIVLLIPFTRLLVGSSIGTLAAIVPLSLAAILLIARATEDTFKTIPKGLVEMGISLGVSHRQIILKIIFPEALSPLIDQITSITITLIGFSAMAGTVGGGGLGDLAIRYGYQRYEILFMVVIVFVLLGLVQTVQVIGNRCARYYRYY